MDETLTWYKSKLGHDLVIDVSNEETAPFSDGALFTQKISFQIGFIRDHITLNIIEKLLRQYRKSRRYLLGRTFITLRKSFAEAMGQPKFIEDPQGFSASLYFAV